MLINKKIVLVLISLFTLVSCNSNISSSSNVDVSSSNKESEIISSNITCLV